VTGSQVVSLHALIIFQAGYEESKKRLERTPNFMHVQSRARIRGLM
jgi:hypothetical protein